MKIKKLIKLLECIEGDYNGKLPQDMYHLGTYTKEGGTWEAIAEMDFVHVMRAFKRVINYDVNLEVSVSQTNQILKLEQEVSRLRERNKILQERMEDLYRRLEKKSWKEVNAPRYMFSEIPNNNYGKAFVDAVKQYLNKSRYSTRVRGQHVKEEYKGTGVTEHGQTIDQSTHLRIYIEEKE